MPGSEAATHAPAATTAAPTPPAAAAATSPGLAAADAWYRSAAGRISQQYLLPQAPDEADRVRKVSDGRPHVLHDAEPAQGGLLRLAVAVVVRR